MPAAPAAVVHPAIRPVFFLSEVAAAVAFGSPLRCRVLGEERELADQLSYAIRCLVVHVRRNSRVRQVAEDAVGCVEVAHLQEPDDRVDEAIQRLYRPAQIARRVEVSWALRWKCPICTIASTIVAIDGVGSFAACEVAMSETVAADADATNELPNARNGQRERAAAAAAVAASGPPSWVR